MSNLDFYNLYAPGHVIDPSINSNWGKFWTAFSAQLDEIDSVSNQLTELNMIQKQSGVNLDNIGRKLGRPRRGYTDETYKILLTIASIDELVDPDFVITNLNALLRPLEIELINSFPAGVLVYTNNINPLIPVNEIGTIINSLWKFARKFTVISTEGANAFSFIGSTGKGFDDITLTADGGILSDVIFTP